MYDKIAAIMNRDYGCVDISADDVENYLRKGDRTFVDEREAEIIETLVEKFL